MAVNVFPGVEYPGRLTPLLGLYVARVLDELDAVPEERRDRLGDLASYISERHGGGSPAKLTFICTHNSRRSHLAQIWAQTAALVFGLAGIETFSGGTEATTFDARAVDALRRAGFLIERAEGGDNPVYVVQPADDAPPMRCFSKVFNQAPNPTEGFAAVMTCSAADQACPAVFGADERFSIPYDDPKVFDGTDQETEMYDERCRQIAREMLLAFMLCSFAGC